MHSFVKLECCAVLYDTEPGSSNKTAVHTTYWHNTNDGVTYRQVPID